MRVCYLAGMVATRVAGFVFSRARDAKPPDQNDKLLLAAREWICPACGTDHMQDGNAAKNIRAEGWRIFAEGRPERLNACEPRVRLARASIAA
jgi:hypothetical protein